MLLDLFGLASIIKNRKGEDCNPYKANPALIQSTQMCCVQALYDSSPAKESLYTDQYIILYKHHIHSSCFVPY